MAKDELEQKLTSIQDTALEKDGDSANEYFKPSKRQRLIRRKVYARYYNMRDNPLRTEAEADWEVADKEYGMVTDTINPDDWRSHLQLPDAFAAIQTQAQETIERKSRPRLSGTEESDEPIEEFTNAVMTYNMNNTGFDYQAFLSKLSASYRGTAFRMDYWRTDKRTVKYPSSVNKETGEIEYEVKEIIDFDDDYTEWIPNEYIYVDEKAKHIDEAVDMIRREVIHIDEFHRVYDNKPGFKNTEYVYPGGETTTRSYFKLPKDITEEDVEVLHYFNRSIDTYWVCANNVPVCDTPLQTKHKELPLVVDYQYRIPGRFWGFGIPKVMHMLSEERKSIRNLNMDRQKIIVGGAFLHNSAFDIDEEDETLYPGKWISIDTNGQPIEQAIKQLQMSDVPSSYFRTEEILLEDVRRATGIDDRITVSNSATTATQAAIVKESTLKRINLISIANEMDAVIRLGRIKWSNIQFFYGTPRLERITQNNDEREEKVYRKMSVQGKSFKIVDDNGKKKLKMEDIKGKSAVMLNAEYAKYLEGNFDISVDADIYTPPSKAIEQTKKTELFSLFLSNPATLANMDVNSAQADLLKVNNVNPDTWLKNSDNINRHDMMMLAESENMVMGAGQPLSGTPGATEDHTLVHLMYTQTDEFKQSPQEIQNILMDHILQEHDNNPATGKASELVTAAGLGGTGAQPAANPGFNPAPLSVGAGETGVPQNQVADLQPTNFANPE